MGVGVIALCAFLGLAVVRLFAAPLKLAVRVAVNTVLGLALLWMLQRTAAVTHFPLGLNFFNAVTVGVLGVPGLVLLLLLRMVFV